MPLAGVIVWALVHVCQYVLQQKDLLLLDTIKNSIDAKHLS